MADSFRILAVDDEPRGVQLLVRCLRGLGRVDTACSGEEAWDLAQTTAFDLVISDQRMPGISGVELLTRIAQRSQPTGRIILTGYTDLESTIEAINRGRVHAYLTKPCSPELLEMTARSVLEKVQLRRDNQRLLENLSAKNLELSTALESLAAAQQRIVDSERLAAIGRMIAMIVHDFRTPLSLVRSAGAELVREEAAPAESRSDLAREILSEVDRMQRMCEELLDVTRASESSSRRWEEDLDEVVAAALSWVFDDASLQGVEVVAELRSEGRLAIDEGRFRRALLNLFVNAFEAMPEGGVLRVSTTLEGEELVLRVTDTGSGIPEPIRDTIFEPFVTSGKPKGTGLGLAIVKKVVEDHGGKIAVAKAEGGGTAFEIRFPRDG